MYLHFQALSVESNAPPNVEPLGAARVTWAGVSLAYMIDTLVGFFMAGEKPTGKYTQQREWRRENPP